MTSSPRGHVPISRLWKMSLALHEWVCPHGVTIGRGAVFRFLKTLQWKRQSGWHVQGMEVVPAGWPDPECKKESPQTQPQLARGSDSGRAQQRQRPHWRLLRVSQSSSCWRSHSLAGQPDPERKEKCSLGSSSNKKVGEQLLPSPPGPSHSLSVSRCLFIWKVFQPLIHVGRGGKSKYSSCKCKTWIRWLFPPPHLLVQTEINALICQLFIECLL